MSGSKPKSVRGHFAGLVREKGYTPEDLQKYREISLLARQAADLRAVECPIATDKCLPKQDCGYDEGGCGTDECCNWCDSCMVLSDTCGGDECGQLEDEYGVKHQGDQGPLINPGGER